MRKKLQTYLKFLFICCLIWPKVIFRREKFHNGMLQTLHIWSSFSLVLDRDEEPEHQTKWLKQKKDTLLDLGKWRHFSRQIKRLFKANAPAEHKAIIDSISVSVFVEFDKYFKKIHQKEIQITIWWWDEQTCLLFRCNSSCLVIGLHRIHLLAAI